MNNIYKISASYLYYEKGERYERSLDILCACDTVAHARVASVRWGLERGTSLGWGSPSCIKLDAYTIGRPEPSGFIRTGILGICGLLEWKYDTSLRTIDQLLSDLEKESANEQ